MCLLSESGGGCSGEQSSDAPHKWASNTVNEQCKLG
jgi:hypothetical protein